MKTIFLFFFSLSVAIAACAQNLVLDNQTSYPNKNKKNKIAIQWAASGKETDEGNAAVIDGSSLNPDTIQFLKQQGKISINIPDRAEYFRVLVWSQDEKSPDLLTNWVDIVQNKTYAIKDDQLSPSILMLGTGC